MDSGAGSALSPHLDSLKYFVDSVHVQPPGGRFSNQGSGVRLALPGDAQVRELVKPAGAVLATQGQRPHEVFLVREGTIIVTNKRLIIKTQSGKTAAIKYGPQTRIYVYSDGLRIEKTVGNTVLRFKSGSDEIAEIVAELMSAVMK